MKGLLLDASVAASWLLNEALSDTAERVLDRMEAGDPVFVPSLWVLEIANVLFSAERRRRIDSRHRDAALSQVERLPVTVCAPPGLPELKVLRTYAEKHQLTIYDAEYLRVAKELRLTLASQDGNLLAAARRERVPVL